jgi:hypothetical protein
MQRSRIAAGPEHRHTYTHHANPFSQINNSTPMIKIETKTLIKSIVDQSPEGISLTHVHNKVQRLITRLKLRCVLGNLYKKEEITRERTINKGRRETMYYPYNGKPPVKRKKKLLKERDRKTLSMKDFMPGKKYAAYIEP